MERLFEVDPARPLKKNDLAPKVEMADVLAWQRRIANRSEDGYRGGARFRDGDVLLARITPCLENGKAALVDGFGEGVVAHGSTEFLVISPKKGRGCSTFAYYLTRDPHFRDYAIRNMTGSSGRQRFSADALRAYRRPFPALAEQRAIASVLGALDNKIEANSRLHDNLVALANEVFLSVCRLAEDGGVSAVAASELIEVNPKVSIPKGTTTPFLPMPLVTPWAVRPDRLSERPYSGGAKFERGDTLLAKITGCIEYGKGAFVDFVEVPAAGSTEFLVLRAKDRLVPEAVFLISRWPRVRDHLIQRMTGSSGRQRVPPQAFDSLHVVVPNSLADWEYEAAAIQSLFGRARQAWQESQRLRALRDTLLPEMLNGTIRVDDEFGEIPAEAA